MGRYLITILFAFLVCSSFTARETPRVLPTAPQMTTPAPQVIVAVPGTTPTPRVTAPTAHAAATPRSATPPSADAASTPPSADEIIKQACTEAAATHKKVMVLFHASWCTWCHKLDTLMASAECKPLFDQSFITCHLTIAESPDKRDQENPGAEDLYAKYADKNSGIPFFLIMTPDGAVIADSRIKPTGAKPGSSGDNIGYPGSKEEIKYFLRVLHETTALTPDQLKTIREKLPNS